MKTRVAPISMLVLAAISAGALPIAAEQRVLKVDPEASEVGFDLEATGEDVHGNFHLQAGEIVFDTESGEASGEIVVQALGAETGSKSRDKKMHKKVLESERYPLILFRPDRVEGELEPEGSSELQLHGTMVLLGHEHPMTLSAQVEVDGNHVTAKTNFEVPFVDWGLHDPSIFILKVAKIVNVGITVEGTLGEPEGLALAAPGD